MAWLTFGAGLAFAQPNPQLEVRQFGWQTDGTVASRSWNPLSVRITGGGTGGDTARVQAILKESLGNGTQTVLVPIANYAQDIALPQGVTKDVRLWLPLTIDGAYVATAQLLDGSGRVLAEQSVNGQAARSDIPLVATLADTSTLAAQLARIEVPYQQGLTAQVRTAELSAADVPTRADYLSAFQGLVVQGTTPATLTAEQKRAIQDWVVRGGNLLILGGPDAARAVSVLDGAEALGVRVAGIEGSADLQPIVDWAGADPAARLGPGAVARIRATDAEPLAGPADNPLAVRLTWGDGSITVSAVDPTLDPLRGSPAAPAFLRRALQPALAALMPDPAKPGPPVQQRPDDARLIGALDALPPDVFPDWQHVALLLGGFALVAGPVLHLVLWRTDRRPWLWIAVPLLSVTTTAGIYLATAAQPGHDVVANAISEIRVDAKTGDARQAVAVGFFAPLRDQLSVRMPGEMPVRVGVGSFAGQGWVNYGPSAPIYSSAGAIVGISGMPQALAFAGVATSSQPGYRVITGRDTQIDFPSDAATQNGLRTLVVSRTMARGSLGQLEADVRLEGPDGLIQGTIRNATPYAMDEVALALGQTITRIGPMAPGQTASVSIDPRAAPPTAPGNATYSFGWQLFGVPSQAVRNATGSATALELPGDPELRRRIKVMDAVFGSGDRNGIVAYGPNGIPIQRAAAVRPMLVALSTAPIAADAVPTAGTQRSFQLSVIEQPVQLTIAPGPFTVPSALLPATVALDPGAVLNPTGGPPSTPPVVDLRGSATVMFHANLPSTARVDELMVTTQQISLTPVGQSGVPTPAVLVPLPGKNAAGPSTDGVFSIYNWQSSSWQRLPAGSTKVSLTPTTGLLGPDGSIRIQVRAGPDHNVRFITPELTLQGEVGR